MIEPKLEVTQEIVGLLEVDGLCQATLEIDCSDVHVVEVSREKAVLEVGQDSLKVVEVARQGPPGPPGPAGPPGSSDPNSIFDGGNF